MSLPEKMPNWRDISWRLHDFQTAMSYADGATSMRQLGAEFAPRISSELERSAMDVIVLDAAASVFSKFNSAGRPVDALMRAANLLEGNPERRQDARRLRSLANEVRSTTLDEGLKKSKETEEEVILAAAECLSTIRAAYPRQEDKAKKQSFWSRLFGKSGQGARIAAHETTGGESTGSGFAAGGDLEALKQLEATSTGADLDWLEEWKPGSSSGEPAVAVLVSRAPILGKPELVETDASPKFQAFYLGTDRVYLFLTVSFPVRKRGLKFLLPTDEEQLNRFFRLLMRSRTILINDERNAVTGIAVPILDTGPLTSMLRECNRHLGREAFRISGTR